MSQSSKTSGPSRGGSLSTAVSSLVRAQYGLKSLESTAAESTDLDKHVAELLLQEAREREARAKASNSATAWSFSDDEDGSKTYTSRTNKRFLKNMLKGVEEHNAPLRRKEESTRESLDDIRRREREARERRLGVKDAERAGRNNGASSSTSTPTSNAGEGRRSAGPGFAARMLASGLSGAIASREEKTREEKGVKAAVDDARRRAERHRDRETSRSYRDDERDGESRSSYKGKERETTHSDDERYSRRRRSRSRERDDQRHRSSRHTSRPDYSSDDSEDERRDRRDRRQRDR